MEKWLRISLLLRTFGFFREMRPSESFSLQYVIPQFNLTSEIINKEIIPVSTYSVLPQLVIIFLITDILRYKPIIIVSGICGLIVYAVAIWLTDALILKISQFFYGTILACEIAYFTYIYARVERERYQIVTSHTRAAILCGRFLGGALGQVLLSTETATLRQLYYITFGSQVAAFLTSIALPKVGKSLYFYAEQQSEEEKTNSKTEEVQNSVAVISVDTTAETTTTKDATKAPERKEKKPAKPQFSWRNAARLLWQQTVSAYRQPIVVKWSIWWALATSAQIQVLIYLQVLWAEIDPKHELSYNGAVEATVTLLGAAATMAAGIMNGSRHKKWHWAILIVCSLIMGIFLIISAITNSIIVCYAMYILFGMVYFFVITIATATVAERLTDDSFALIFGINTLFAMGFQTLLTVIVISDAGLAYGPREQYLVYGGFYIVLAVIFSIAIVVKFILRHTNKAKYILKSVN